MPSQITPAEVINNSGDLDLELAGVISDLESTVRRRADRKAAIEAAFGSMESGLASVLANPLLKEMLEEELRAGERASDRALNLLLKRLDQSLAQMADVPHWRALAASDLREFRRQQAAILGQYKKLLHAICGIRSHRPKNEAQNWAIWGIKSSKPEWSFGQVAREYTRRTGKPMTAKIAERTFTRMKPDAEAVGEDYCRACVRMLMRLKETTKAWKASAAESRTT